MRTFGFIAVAVGIVMLLFSCNMDVSVSTGFGSRVNNIGLMHEQTVVLVTSLGLILVGIIMWIAGKKKPEQSVDLRSGVRTYTPEEMKDLDVLLADKGWTGISLRSDDPRVVHSVAAGTVAAAAGVTAGDRLVQIDGRFASDDLRENVMQLAGEPHTPVSLTIRRGDQAIQIEMVRASVADHSEHLPPAVGPLEPILSPEKPGANPDGLSVWIYLAIFGGGLILLYFRMS